ncbi:MAG: DNA topoisomerase [Clostridia bacterium]|nr:DNA topoisomerase [Clostridia bacterium]
MPKTKASYSNDDITLLKGPDKVRKRPGVIFGSDGLEGCEHSVFEIVSNSVDEAREGFGKVITVTVFRDMSIEVEDKGRGMPLDYNEKEKRYNWDLIFCELYAGGKYNNNAGGGNYEYSLGLNGLGACATQFSSEYMEVKSYRDGNLYEINFKKGNPASKLKITPLDKRRTGTIIKWRPDLEVFTDINMPKDFFTEMLHKQAVVNSGIKFVLKFEGNGGFETTEYYYEHGISDYVLEAAGTPMTQPVIWATETQGRDRADLSEYKLKVELTCCFTQNRSFVEHYHNSSFLEHGGAPDDAMRNAFVFAVDKYLKNNAKYNKNEAKVRFDDIGASLVFVSNNFSTQTSYENQTKKSITNKFIKDFLTDYIKQQLETYFIENPLDAEQIANVVLANKRSRESAEKTRLKTRDDLIKNIDIKNKVEKFINCRSKDPDMREVYIVEGDSAMTSCKLARDPEFQAIIPVRGKTLNCLKAGYDKIFKSDIIRDLLRVIGCGVKIDGKFKTEFPKFDINLLKWNKIIICTDADEDGFQIRTLILTLIYRLLPDLIDEGRVYIAESPLYEITVKDDTYFAYNEFEKADILAKLEGTKYTLQRSKGLGENTPQMMSQTTMNPATRRLIRVDAADAEQTAIIFDTLLGDNLPARKEFITLNGARYAKDADI